MRIALIVFRLSKITKAFAVSSTASAR